MPSWPDAILRQNAGKWGDRVTNISVAVANKFSPPYGSSTPFGDLRKSLKKVLRSSKYSLLTPARLFCLLTKHGSAFRNPHGGIGHESESGDGGIAYKSYLAVAR